MLIETLWVWHAGIWAKANSKGSNPLQLLWFVGQSYHKLPFTSPFKHKRRKFIIFIVIQIYTLWSISDVAIWEPKKKQQKLAMAGLWNLLAGLWLLHYWRTTQYIFESLCRSWKSEFNLFDPRSLSYKQGQSK